MFLHYFLQISKNPQEYGQRLEEIKNINFRTVEEMADGYFEIYDNYLGNYLTTSFSKAEKKNEI